MKFTPIIDRIEYGGALIGMEEKIAIMEVINNSGGKRWTIGPESEAFESELAKKTGVRRAVVVNSGSSALLLVLAALKLPKGANVVIPALNFPTAFNAIIQNGYNPVVVDVDLETMNISLDQVQKLFDDGWDISAVIAVDVAGNPVDLPRLRRIVGSKTKIVLDNCDGYGTLLNDKFIDTYADVSCVSFHAAHIITTGEGGAVLTDDNKIADTVKKLREWGRASGTDKIYHYPGFPSDYRERYVYEEIGYNLKPLELQCAMGRIQLGKLEVFRDARRTNFDRLSAIFHKYPKLIPVEWLPNSETCWFSFPFICDKVFRSEVMRTLEENNIECRTIFSGNILLHPAYKDIKCSVPFKQNPNATRIMYDGVFISVHPSITQEMIDWIDEVLGGIC